MKITLFAGLLSLCAVAQTPSDPPSVIRVVRNGSIQPYAYSNASVNVVGMSAISGLSETWLIEMHDSFASLEDLDKALSAAGPARTPAEAAQPSPDELLAPSHTLIAVYRPGLSYRPDQAIQVFPKTRYVDVVICRIRPGTEADFAGVVKLRSLGYDSINLDRPEIAYQIISGAPAGTYVFIAPLASLRLMDDGRPNTPAYAEGVQATARKQAAETEILREHLWFRVEPRMSYVSGEFAAPDAVFWHPKPK